ncbi:HAD-like domain-containing protein [Clohesyomyces aquaticus]|uniref:HAD-like domain-containing protein n=1 Tax=Clohesyomyces aquaticus TaxID=1231657 RepID=A0A1Y1ZPF3_9PLEO|nr:HAD-like domain-containing protein [Clohesyomyces aquaticus]
MPDPFPRPRNAIHFVLDWDGTLTQHDTLEALVSVAMWAKPNTGVPDRWHRVSETFVADYAEALLTHKPEGTPTVAKERKWLKDVGEVEKTSVNRVNDSGIFENVSASQMQAGAVRACTAGKVELRKGVGDFFEYVRTHSVSNNNERYLDVDCRQPNHISIYANELEGMSRNFSSGMEYNSGLLGTERTNTINTSHDKLTYLQRIRKVSPWTMKPIPIVYVGDSWTDFECLLAADLGICIRDGPMNSAQKKLHDSLQRLGIKCPHLRDYKTVDEWGVVWARDFREIRDWVAGMWTVE